MTSQQHEAPQTTEQGPYAGLCETLETAGLAALVEARRATTKNLYRALAANPAAQPIPWVRGRRMSEQLSNKPMIQAKLGELTLTGSTMNIGVYAMRPIQQVTIAAAESSAEPQVFNTDTVFDPFRSQDPSVRSMQQVVEDVIVMQTLCDQLQPAAE